MAMRTFTERAGAPASWVAAEPWRVAGARRESADTVTLELEPPSRFTFQPGQFNMIYAKGIGEVPISISSDPGDQGRILHTIRDVGAVTHALCAIEPGDQLGVRGPYGSHWRSGQPRAATLSSWPAVSACRRCGQLSTTP